MKQIICILISVLAVHAADSVWVEPAQPTNHDSLTFHLFLEDNCCCTQYHNVQPSVVGDSGIYLSFESDTRQCAVCMCFAPGSWLEVAMGPVTEGVYDIYKVDNMYCPPGEVCILSAAIPVKVGRIIVSGPTATLPVASTQAQHLAGGASGESFTLSGQRLDSRGADRTTGLVVRKTILGAQTRITQVP